MQYWSHEFCLAQICLTINWVHSQKLLRTLQEKNIKMKGTLVLLLALHWRKNLPNRKSCHKTNMPKRRTCEKRCFFFKKKCKKKLFSIEKCFLANASLFGWFFLQFLFWQIFPSNPSLNQVICIICVLRFRHRKFDGNHCHVSTHIHLKNAHVHQLHSLQISHSVLLYKQWKR